MRLLMVRTVEAPNTGEAPMDRYSKERYSKIWKMAEAIVTEMAQEMARNGVPLDDIDWGALETEAFQQLNNVL
jgi:hypothetical protein